MKRKEDVTDYSTEQIVGEVRTPGAEPYAWLYFFPRTRA